VTSDRGYTMLKVASDTDCSRTLIMEVKAKAKQPRYRPGVAQRVPGS